MTGSPELERFLCRQGGTVVLSLHAALRWIANISWSPLVGHGLIVNRPCIVPKTPLSNGLEVDKVLSSSVWVWMIQSHFEVRVRHDMCKGLIDVFFFIRIRM